MEPVLEPREHRADPGSKQKLVISRVDAALAGRTHRQYFETFQSPNGSQGAWAEMVVEQRLLADGYVPVHTPKVTGVVNPDAQIGSNGIDHLFVDPKTGRGSVIVETKSGQPNVDNIDTLGETDSGTQMSNEWIGENLERAAGEDRAPLFGASDRLLARVPVDQFGVQNVGVSLFEITPVGDRLVSVAVLATRVL